MTQSKKQSFIEANANTWIGLVVSWTLMQLAMLFVDYITLFWATNLGVAMCTVWSLVRGYLLRRYFNRFTNSHAESEPLLALLQECSDTIVPRTSQEYDLHNRLREVLLDKKTKKLSSY